jgi:hypothetical protein
VFIEADMRAQANPTHMANIKTAAEDLARRLRCACPACGAGIRADGVRSGFAVSLLLHCQHGRSVQATI